MDVCKGLSSVLHAAHSAAGAQCCFCKRNLQCDLQFCLRIDKYEFLLVADVLPHHKYDNIPSFLGAINFIILGLFVS